MTEHLLTEAEFDARFTVIPGPDGSDWRSDPPKDIDVHYVWTVCDGEDNTTFAANGWHLVNRFAWMVTKEPWVGDDDLWMVTYDPPNCGECGEPLTAEGSMTPEDFAASGADPVHVFCDVCGEAEHPADMTPDWDGEAGVHLSCK